MGKETHQDNTNKKVGEQERNDRSCTSPTYDSLDIWTTWDYMRCSRTSSPYAPSSYLHLSSHKLSYGGDGGGGTQTQLLGLAAAAPPAGVGK